MVQPGCKCFYDMKTESRRTRFFKKTKEGKLLKKLSDGGYREVKRTTKWIHSLRKSTLSRLICND